MHHNQVRFFHICISENFSVVKFAVGYEKKEEKGGKSFLMILKSPKVWKKNSWKNWTGSFNRNFNEQVFLLAFWNHFY